MKGMQMLNIICKCLDRSQVESKSYHMVIRTQYG